MYAFWAGLLHFKSKCKQERVIAEDIFIWRVPINSEEWSSNGTEFGHMLLLFYY